MRRLIISSFGAALLASGVTGCSWFGGSDPQAPVLASGHGREVPNSPLAVDNRSFGQKTYDTVVAPTTSAVNGASERVAAAFEPSGPQQPEISPNDPTSLANTPDIGPDQRIVFAQVHERSGNLNGAAEQYQRALAQDPNHLSALLGLARLYDRGQNFDEANRWYREAAHRHPRDAMVLNDHALCLMRQNNHQAAVQLMSQAVRLDPKNPRYRNNLATALVRSGRYQEAVDHLSAVHPPAVAHYNMGYLLVQMKEVNLARSYFAKSAELDPNFAAARQWMAALSQPANQR